MTYSTINRYGGSTFFPELVAGFIGTLFAFVLGLWWERRREQRQLVAAAEDVKRQQETEIRRRFAAVLPELEKDSESLDVLEPGLQPNEQLFTILHPQLLEGAWTANAPRLSQLVGDFELVSDLATF